MFVGIWPMWEKAIMIKQRPILLNKKKKKQPFNFMRQKYSFTTLIYMIYSLACQDVISEWLNILRFLIRGRAGRNYFTGNTLSRGLVVNRAQIQNNQGEKGAGDVLVKKYLLNLVCKSQLTNFIKLPPYPPPQGLFCREVRLRL